MVEIVQTAAVIDATAIQIIDLSAIPIPLVGDDGIDVLVGDDDADFIGGAGGNDILVGAGGDDRLFGGDGDDVVVGGAGNDVLAGNAGDDVLIGGAGDDVLQAAGSDPTELKFAPITHGFPNPLLEDLGSGLLLGGAGKDRLIGGASDDILAGGDGRDSLSGKQGDDILSGGAGDDIVAGGAGFDKIALGEGADRVIYSRLQPQFETGFFASEDIFEAPGVDVVLDFNVSEDVLDLRLTEMSSLSQFFAAARDTSFGMQVFFGGNDVLKLKGVSVADINQANLLLADPDNAAPTGVERIAASAVGDDGDNVLRAGLFGDRLHGDRGDDVLIGDANDDALFGGDGDDRLCGDGGDDLLNGGEGLNILTGGAGSDTFAFTDFPNDGAGMSVVKDFDAGEDLLSFVRIGFETLADVLAAARETTYGLEIALGDGAFAKLIGVSLNDLNDDNVSLSLS